MSLELYRNRCHSFQEERSVYICVCVCVCLWYCSQDPIQSSCHVYILVYEIPGNFFGCAMPLSDISPLPCGGFCHGLFCESSCLCIIHSNCGEGQWLPLGKPFKLWGRACGLSCWWMRQNALTGWQEFIWSFSLYLRDCGHCVRSVCWSWWSRLMQPDCGLWMGTTLPLDYVIWKKHIRNTKGKGRLC